MIALLLASLFGLFYQARRYGRYLVLLPGIVGSAGIYVSLFVVQSLPIKTGSIALFLGASIFNAMPMIRKAGSSGDCPSCQK